MQEGDFYYSSQVSCRLHIKKYRQLDADGKIRIDKQIDFELYQQEQDAKKEGLKLG